MLYSCCIILLPASYSYACRCFDYFILGTNSRLADNSLESLTMSQSVGIAIKLGRCTVRVHTGMLKDCHFRFLLLVSALIVDGHESL